MSVPAGTATTTEDQAKRPLWLPILAGYSWVLGIITGIPQLYYVLYALHVVSIGPHSNFLGYIWYAYILNGDNSYLHVDPGTLAGAIEDAFLLGPLYFTTGLGLWWRSPWALYVGLMTGAMIFYAILGFFLGDIFATLNTVTNTASNSPPHLPSLIYPHWLVPTLLVRRNLFQRGGRG